MISNSGKKIGFHEASDYLPFETMQRLVHQLYKDKKYVLSVFIGVGAYTLLRVSDIKMLTWEQLMSPEPFVVQEKKTGKKRVIKINPDFQEHIKRCFEALKISSPKARFLMSQKKSVYSTQRLNVILKELKVKYKIKDCPNFSCHSLRKSGARKIYESALEQGNGEDALTKLSIILSHSSPTVTKVYLGIRTREIIETYECLTFV